MDKGVLFLLGGWGVGGAERVTAVLANEFANRGWRVGIGVFRFEDKALLDGINPAIKCLEMTGKRFAVANVKKLHDFIVGNRYGFIVNGWCMPYAHTRFIRRAIASANVKLIALHHNVPNMNNRIANARNPLLRELYRLISAWNLHMVYRKSDAYVVLSECFRKIFLDFARVRDASKLHAISNPLTLRQRLRLPKKTPSFTLAVWRRRKSACHGSSRSGVSFQHVSRHGGLTLWEMARIARTTSRWRRDWIV